MTDYRMKTKGQITRFEAGVFYKAWKSGKVTAKREFGSMLYDAADRSIRFATERYNQDSRYYDNVERLTTAILNEDYEAAQDLIEKIEAKQIELAGQKSPWFKYQ